MPREDQTRLRRAARQQLESLHAAGLGQLPKAIPRIRTPSPPPAAAARDQPGPAKTTTHSTLASRPTTPPPVPVSASQSPKRPLAPPSLLIEEIEEVEAAMPRSTAATLEVLRQEVAACTRCEELARTRTQTVFGIGDPKARLCFMGEAPGADEDRLGEPFVGRAGQLLNKIIEACQMRREEVYILNTIKCRPPGNRNPLPAEAANCRPYLDRQLELLKPEFICCLGAVAAQNLLGTPQTIGKLRGRIHKLGAIHVVCTYHPAYLLRNPSAKKDTWEDMKLLMRALGKPVD